MIMDERENYKLMSIDEVIKTFKSRPVMDWQKEVHKAAQFYGTNIMTEQREVVITEDAEVISIETIIK